MPFPYDYDDTSNTITEQVVDDFTGELRKITNLGLGKEEKPKKGGMIMVITMTKPKKVGIKEKKK